MLHFELPFLMKCFFRSHIMHFLYKFYPYLKKIKDIIRRTCYLDEIHGIFHKRKI